MSGERLASLADPADTPDAVRRLGERVFVTTNLRRMRQDEIELAFFNRDLAARLGYVLPDGLAALERVACEAFALEIDEEGPLTAWVDRQRDPLGIAMNGNEGAGRAVYVGRSANLKGVGRTPLAAAPRDSEHGHGYVDIVDAAWECVASDAFFFDASFGTSPVISLLRRRTPCRITTGYADEEVETAIIARVDDGALDRPTHLFVPGAELRASLLDTTRAFARQEAEKFVLGVIHGAFSAGNISVRGHILDMDTVRSVLGRNPQYSLTCRHITNLFGLEWRGALKILKSLAESDRNNPESLSQEVLTGAFRRAYAEALVERTLLLCGIPSKNVDRVVARFPEASRHLAAEFQELGMMAFPDLCSLYTGLVGAPRADVFDFSHFFRHVHRLRRAELDAEGRVESGVKLLRRTPPRFDFVDHAWMAEDVKAHLRRWHLVEDAERLAALEGRAREFVGRFDAFCASVASEGLLGVESVVDRAYVINEERFYLSGYGQQWLENLLEARRRGEIGQENLCRCIEAMTRANRRMAGNERYDMGTTADLRVFRQGVVGRLLDGAGRYRYFYEPFASEASGMSICVNGEELPLWSVASGDGSVWVSAPRSVMMIPERAEFGLFCGGTPIALEDYCEASPSIPFALTPRLATAWGGDVATG